MLLEFVCWCIYLRGHNFKFCFKGCIFLVRSEYYVYSLCEISEGMIWVCYFKGCICIKSSDNVLVGCVLVHISVGMPSCVLIHQLILLNFHIQVQDTYLRYFRSLVRLLLH